ncbi:MAG: DUF1002 domain-containing protein [archaeon]|nr:DUF1002 domain-containing protein [archaeon]
MYNNGPLEEDPEVKKLYNKTHGYTDPGQQKDREYVNLPFDPKNHMFGYRIDYETDGAKKSLMTDNLTNPYPKTKIVDKRLEDFRQANNDMLGISKFRGTLSMDLPPDHTFGYKSNIKDPWNAGKCISGDGSLPVTPDIDLGRSSHYASKLKNGQPLEVDPNRVCGIPSIRKDLVKGSKPSILNMNNYGDEKDAYELLYPHPCAVRGLDFDDFDKPLSKEEVKEIMNNNNIKITDEEFNLIWTIGEKNYPSQEGKLSSSAFISTMKNLKREYEKYKFLVEE